MTQPIGIFDSGIGGLSVLKALRTELPNEYFIYLADSGHAPYGERDDAHVVDRSLKIAAHLAKQNVKALVVACNTATAAAIDVLRARYPDLPIIGVEPALKPAVSLSKTKRIAVMATRSTLGSARFTALLAAQSGQARFELLPCDGLAEAIEKSVHQSSATELIAACARIIGASDLFNIQKATENSENGATSVDTLVLGCTHYPFAAQHIAALVGTKVQLLDTGDAVARQTARLAGEQRVHQPPVRPVEFISTGNPAALRAAAATWLGLQSDVQILSI